jgi:DNA-binding response OmpR family regulator
MGRSLAGQYILIVEDEYFIAADLARALEAEGATILGPFCDLVLAMKAARENHIDLALLDVNLNGERCYSVAELLEDRAVPFLFLTGYDRATLPERFRSVPRLTKPFSTGAVLREIGQLVVD